MCTGSVCGEHFWEFVRVKKILKNTLYSRFLTYHWTECHCKEHFWEFVQCEMAARARDPQHKFSKVLPTANFLYTTAECNYREYFWEFVPCEMAARARDRSLRTRRGSSTRVWWCLSAHLHAGLLFEIIIVWAHVCDGVSQPIGAGLLAKRSVS
jgi:hypothetical protein